MRKVYSRKRKSKKHLISADEGYNKRVYPLVKISFIEETLS